uniref:Uncharacterized protein n=1 Tax=Phaeodactylum tricornutum TaxID=2850 RepID=A0A8J9SGK4_PHATR
MRLSGRPVPKVPRWSYLRRRRQRVGRLPCLRTSKSYVGLCVAVALFLYYHQDLRPPRSDQSLSALRASQTPRDRKHATVVKSIVMVLFGVPKEFPTVWRFYRNNLMDANPEIHFSVAIHLYSDIQVLTNLKNNETSVAIASADDIRAILSNTNATVVQSSQLEYDQSLTWIRPEHVVGRMKAPPWTVDTMKNMFRQGNSMLLAYQEAVRSFPDADGYLFARSDTLLIRPTVLQTRNVQANDLYLPSWQVFKDEYVDRFAYAGGQAAASVYAESKAIAFAEYIRSDRDDFWRCSERLLRIYIEEYNNNTSRSNSGSDRPFTVSVHLESRKLKWAPLLRVRGGGMLNERDYHDFVDKKWSGADYPMADFLSRKTQ